MFSKFVTAAALTIVSLSASAAAANIVLDGSFEDEIVHKNTWSTFNGSIGIGATDDDIVWSTGAAGVEVRNNVVGVAEQGKNFVELDTTGNSSISQVLNTTIGQSYQLSFWVEDRAGVAASSQGINYTVAGVTKSVTGVGTLTNWTEYFETFKATSKLTTLTFAATGTSDSFGSSLDNVSVSAVSAVPEPASVAMLVGGLALVGVARRRSANSNNR